MGGGEAHGAAHEFDEPSGDGQSEAGAVVTSSVGGVELLEGLEEQCGLLGRDANAGVDDLEAEGGWGSERTRTVTEPCWVNLSPLPRRLRRTWRRRPGSPVKAGGDVPVPIGEEGDGLAVAGLGEEGDDALDEGFELEILLQESHATGLDLGEVEGMSLMMVRRACPLRPMVSASSRCRVSRRDCWSSSVMPRIPFIGVRISWLIVARNSLFARFAASAASRAAAISRAKRF